MLDLLAVFESLWYWSRALPEDQLFAFPAQLPGLPICLRVV